MQLWRLSSGEELDLNIIQGVIDEYVISNIQKLDGAINWELVKNDGKRYPSTVCWGTSHFRGW